MNEVFTIENEQAAAKAFDQQAPLFDDQYGGDTIIQYKRKRVRDHILSHIKPGSTLLELNAGTGEDAIFFARSGHTVHATDISAAMQERLIEKSASNELQVNLSNELCSYTELHKLQNRGPYDLIFSNFAGLNCTHELPKVLRSFDGLLKPGGLVTLVILPKFCLWETLLMLRGKFKTAFRRFSGSRGTRAHIEGKYFRCWYYNPSFVIKHLNVSFEPVAIEGLCTLVPPSYLQGFAEKHPRLYRTLVQKENEWKCTWPWRCMGDYYIITLKKK
jgi:ubiquinone/menaquinone biosynthesis C-methylase UbiE